MSRRSSIFRQKALDRLSSPEQLDQVIEVTAYRWWIALIALLSISVTALAWAYRGTIATTVGGTGLIVRQGRVLSVPVRSSGIVLSLDVRTGDHVSTGQAVATVAQESLFAELQAARQSLDEKRRQYESETVRHQEEIDLAMEALRSERENIGRAIKDFEDEAVLAQEQIPIVDTLFSKGLVTEQSTIAARREHARIKRSIADLHARIAQIDAEEFAQRSQIERTESDDALEIARLERTVEIMASNLSMAQTVTSPHSGQVLEIKVDRGAAVENGTPILTIQPDRDNLEALIYLSSREAKDIQVGMEVQLSPSHVRREEYGYIVGKVTFVADYPTTDVALMRNFQNEKLVATLLSGEPVTEARVELQTDPSTPSGFHWSSSSGPAAAISSGTFCDALVVVRRQAPITLLVPYLKNVVGLQ